jgi:hypothetical protein
MASLEEQVRAELDVARGLSDVSLKIQTGAGQKDISGDEIITLLLQVSTALMSCTVDLARAIDQLADHTDYPLEPRDRDE